MTGCAERPGDVGSDQIEPSDPGLMVAIARGANGALAEVYRRHSDQVHGLALRLCGHGRAEDVVHEVFLELWRKPERFVDERGSVRTLLLMQTYRRSLETTAWEPFGSEAVARHLCAVPDAERDAIVLASFGGHTYRDVARALGQPEGTVKTRIRSGLTCLRRQLSDEGRAAATARTTKPRFL